MTTPEETFLKRLRATFQVEADEHLRAMSSGLLNIEKCKSDAERPALVEDIFRHAHSLKGAARAVNLYEVESVCQALESIFSEWKRGRLSPVSEQFDTLHRALDLISKTLTEDDPVTRTLVKAQAQSTVNELKTLETKGEAVVARASHAEDGPPASDIQTGSFPAPATGGEISLGMAPEHAQTAVAVAAVEMSVNPTKDFGAGPVDPTPIAQTVRISTGKLDTLLLETEELLSVRLAAARRTADLRELQTLVDEWKGHWAKVEPRLSDPAGNPVRLQSESVDSKSPAPNPAIEFLDWNVRQIESLERKLRVFAKAAAQDQAMTGRRVQELLAGTKQLLMLPFSTLLDIFPKIVRDLSREQGKEVELVIRGGEVEIDKRILEEMKDALMHLIRNCIDHGIEKPDVRLNRNKPRRATITIAVSRLDGGNVEILVSDDGAGIHLARVKEAAVKRGILSNEEAQRLDDQNTVSLIFQSDVSTSPIITEISGRGLGMAIVREKAEKLGGRITVESQLHNGTVFHVVLPTLMAVFRGILVRAANQDFVIPTINVERAVRLKPADIRTVENRETITLNGCILSLAGLEAVLKLRHDSQRTRAPEYLNVVVLATGGERVAFTVDQVLDEQEVLVKRFKKPLVRVRNISGATILGSGKVVPILNVADLFKSARNVTPSSPAAESNANEAKIAARRKRILVAEDSITSRMLLKGILESAGHEVKTVVDGMEALGELRLGEFDLVVSDIEMPRMTGFDLTAQIRADRKLADLPVILVTALASREDRERGIDAGASAYIVKSSFDQSNLLEAVRRLV